jgi:hypothetical protein
LTAPVAPAAGVSVVDDGEAPAAAVSAFASSGALPAGGDLDARLLPWATLRRLCLEAGLQPPVDEPLSAAQWRALCGEAAFAASLPDPDERRTALRLAALPIDRTWRGARLLWGWSDEGALVPAEAGLAWGPGWNAAAELGVQVARGRWWLAATGRLETQTGWGAGPVPSRAEAATPLLWPDWSPVTGPGQERLALLQGEGTRARAVRAVAGVELGRWALSAGWEPRRDGPGLGGALLLDRGGPSFPALTARRLAPFRWPGPWRRLAPESLLLRVGLLGRTTVIDDVLPGGPRQDRPWLLQWLVRWRVTGWFRVGATETVEVVPRSGSLWADLPGILFPGPDQTWAEQTSGPLTDRVAAFQFEGRWRHAPWPWLPAAAGRAWWEYAGTDALPSGPGGLIPRLSAPASVAGVELVSPRWDLAAEYAETLHPLVLWYSNESFPAGYTNDGRLLGHPLGGAGERWSATVRWRAPAGAGGWFAEVEAGRSTWGDQGHTPTRARAHDVALTVGGLRGGVPGPWRLHAGWRRRSAQVSEAWPARSAWTAWCERRF